MYRRERPVCRKVIEQLLKEQQCTLQELLNACSKKNIILSDGLRTQYRKMLEEK